MDIDTEYEDLVAEETLKLINDDGWFTETIGVDGYSSGPRTDEQTIIALREAYLADDGAAFLRVVKSYANPAFVGIAECKADEAVKAEAQHRRESADVNADVQREIWKELREGTNALVERSEAQ